MSSVSQENMGELICQPCHENGTTQEAVGMCRDCVDYLCRHCFDVHKTPKPMKTHELITIDLMLKNPSFMTRKDKCTEKCIEHDEEVIEYYCKKHHQLVCKDCRALEHRRCEVTHIPLIAKNLDNNEKYKREETRLKSMFEKFNHLLRRVNQSADAFYNGYTAAVKTIQEFRKEINTALDRLEEGLIEKVEIEKQDMMDGVKGVTQNINSALTELQKMLSTTSSLHDSGRNCELYIFYIKATNELQSINDLLRKTEIMGNAIKNSVSMFVANTGLLKKLEDPEAFGKLFATEIKTTETKENPSIDRPERKKDMYVRIESDEYACRITGSVVLLDNDLLLADYNNNCIKYVNQQKGKVTKTFKLSSSPWDITMVTNSRAVVTLPDERDIAFVKIGNVAMDVERRVYVKNCCFGIDYMDGKLAVSFTLPHQVQVFNLQGDLLHSIENNRQYPRLFSEPGHLVFGQDNSTLYVSNWTNHNVVCVKVDGSVVATFAHGMLEYPTGLVVDKSGNVYVCGQCSHNIHQITKDFTKMEIVRTKHDGLNEPLSISYSETDDIYFIGMYDDHVLVR